MSNHADFIRSESIPLQHIILCVALKKSKISYPLRNHSFAQITSPYYFLSVFRARKTLCTSSNDFLIRKKKKKKKHIQESRFVKVFNMTTVLYNIFKLKIVYVKLSIDRRRFFKITNTPYCDINTYLKISKFVLIYFSTWFLSSRSAKIDIFHLINHNNLQFVLYCNVSQEYWNKL